jgi:hypothetical protein
VTELSGAIQQIRSDLTSQQEREARAIQEQQAQQAQRRKEHLDALNKQHAGLLSTLQELHRSQTTNSQKRSREEELVRQEVELEISESTKVMEAMQQQIATAQAEADKTSDETTANPLERLRALRKGLSEKTKDVAGVESP